MFPQNVGIDLFFRPVSREVSSAPQSLTSVFGMGTGGPFASKTPTADLSAPFRVCVSNDLFFRPVSREVSSALQSLTSVFGMGTGGPFALQSLTYGAPSGTRTPDPLIKSQLLDQLS